MNYKVFPLLLFFLFNSYVNADSVLVEEVKKKEVYTLDRKIQQIEFQIKNDMRSSPEAVAERAQLTESLALLRKEQANQSIKKATKGFDMSSLLLDQVVSRIEKKKEFIGVAFTKVVSHINEKIVKSDALKERPLILHRDVNPADIFTAKELGGENKKILVYKTKDSEGRTLYKTLDGKDTDAIVEKKLFPKGEVIIRNETGSVTKGRPTAIYPDGTLEVKGQNGLTVRSSQGAYHLEEGPQVKSKVPAFDAQDLNKLSDQDQKAIEAVRQMLCH